jgi:hypothetical protein
MSFLMGISTRELYSGNEDYQNKKDASDRIAKAIVTTRRTIDTLSKQSNDLRIQLSHLTDACARSELDLNETNSQLKMLTERINNNILVILNTTDLDVRRSLVEENIKLKVERQRVVKHLDLLVEMHLEKEKEHDAMVRLLSVSSDELSRANERMVELNTELQDAILIERQQLHQLIDNGETKCQ